jgi:HPt (histidine-containing phosphotransfer) domain-containing protein
MNDKSEINPDFVAQVIDPQAIAKILHIADHAFVVEMIDTYSDDAQKFMIQIENAYDSGSAEIMCHAAHSLKSISSSMGAMELSNICRDLEILAKYQKKSLSSEQLAQIQAEYIKVCEALSHYRVEYDLAPNFNTPNFNTPNFN